ncbi:gliding motility-associated C-terminal domain-containing protein [Mucilaginibacter sp. 21P]|uniref:PKD domain-containing protein n=1 Tax=Mucilaginibacter sp. 21P TaxID=2778902 RepID=UPI001C5A20D6|nr:PKD domain-containing protein [Mucilaginibacter sp. 21P]QXV64354.1 gliding motility-associated C-terminal domain-containing protein [Mucilaginibacter sp. 21P]
MGKNFTKNLFIVFALLVSWQNLQAQTITIGAVDPGPYGQGSTIAAPITIDNTSGCINLPTNVFKLYLSDASGNFGSQVQIGSYTGFYATFVNGIIPTGTLAGAGYRVKVVSTIPAVTSTISAPFSINTSAGVIAATSSQTLGSDPEVFGTCVGSPGITPYSFINNSTTGSMVTGTFINEFDKAVEATNQSFPTNFNAKASNYTVVVKAVNGGTVGTKAYSLINNIVFRNLGGSGDNVYCLGASSVANFTVTIDAGANNGIRYNYPGMTYKVSWGDGTTSVYTYCQLVADNGVLSHTYTRSSCGNKPDNQNINVFKVDITPVNPYCSTTVTPSSAYAKILSPPTNRFSYPVAACTNTPVKFDNTSEPGMDPNSTSLQCQNQNAQYTWLVDDVAVAFNKNLNDPFIYTFTTHGVHKVTLRLQNNTGLCTAVDASENICVQDAPIPNFDLPTQACLSSGSITPVSTSVVDEICNTSTTYNWVKVSGPAGVTFNAALKTPTLNFTQIGVYQFRLDITTPSCGTVQGPVKTIVVNDTPIATLSPNTTICTVNSPVSFDPSAGDTKTILTGTAQPDGTTYTWTLNNGATFAIGSDSHTQYPQIIFPTVGNYIVTVTHQNNCGTSTSTQEITVAQGPTVTATATSPICEGNAASVTGSPGVGGIVTKIEWSTASGGTFADKNATFTSYTPSAADIAAGQVVLTYTVTTSLGGACGTVSKNVVVQIIKKATVTSLATDGICSGVNFKYTITSATATDFSWTAALTSGTATGFGATGSGNTINDLITNTSNSNATVTYTITPFTNGCSGTPFALTLTVYPQAIGGTATADQTTVCAEGNSGKVTLAGYLGNIVWQQSADGGTNWTDITPLQTSPTYNYVNLTQTTVFRARLTSGSCGIANSAPATITVTPTTPAANAGADPTGLCATTAYTLQGNDPGTFVGEWTQVSGPPVTFANAAKYNTDVTGLAAGNTYTFRWTIKGLSPCGDKSDDVIVRVNPDVTASFTVDAQACGTGPVQFTNTSTVTTGINFLWDFGDGSPTSTEVNPKHSFQVDGNGLDKQYTVSLSIIGNCINRPPVTKTITLSPETPIAGIQKQQGAGGCGVLTLTVRNLSPGTNSKYEFRLVDENNVLKESIVKTNNDKSDAVFATQTINRAATWQVFMIATNSCGISAQSAKLEVPVSPGGLTSGMQIQGSPTSVCVGQSITLINTSTGGSSFLYTVYNADGTVATTIPKTNTGNITYTFANPGAYYFTIKATNAGCGTAPESDKVGINVYSLPKPSFTYTVDVNNKVTFVNTTPSADGVPATTFTYTWKFGDGTPDESSFKPMDHSYDYVNSPYTVTLIAKSPAGCEQQTTRQITIKFLGELFLPNAFQPASSVEELRTFKAKGQKLREWNLQIFNNWGQLIWQTTALDGNGSPVNGWDGTWKGQPVPQGVYIWQATARFSDGSDWKGNSLNGSLPKRTGVIHLIR